MRFTLFDDDDLKRVEDMFARTDMKTIPSKPVSLPDLERVLREYKPPGALVPPASFAREGVDLRVLAKLLSDGPAPLPDGLDACVAWADRHG